MPANRLLTAAAIAPGITAYATPLGAVVYLTGAATYGPNGLAYGPYPAVPGSAYAAAYAAATLYGGRPTASTRALIAAVIRAVRARVYARTSLAGLATRTATYVRPPAPGRPYR